VRYNNRCLALGAARWGKRAVVLTTCRPTAKGQRWLLESQTDGTVTVKSATTRAMRLVGRTGGVYARTTPPRDALKFTIR
jgi:hypothetical protein